MCEVNLEVNLSLSVQVRAECRVSGRRDDQVFENLDGFCFSGASERQQLSEGDGDKRFSKFQRITLLQLSICGVTHPRTLNYSHHRRHTYAGVLIWVSYARNFKDQIQNRFGETTQVLSTVT